MKTPRSNTARFLGENTLMSYNTRYTLKLENGTPGITPYFIECYGVSAIQKTGDCNCAQSWYEHEEQLREFSKRFPDTIFHLSCKGEDGELWKEYYQNGLMQREEAVITYGEFDKSKLQ